MDEVIFFSLNEKLNDFWDKFASWMNDHGYQIILVLLLAYIVKKFSTQIIMKVLEKSVRLDLYPTKSDRSKRLKTLGSMIGAIARVAVTVIAGIMIISELGLNTTPVIASAGVLGLALGFGAQSLIKDLTSGLFIITENQYRVGDYVEINNQIRGIVTAITIRTTVLRNLDGTLYHIPNGTIIFTANKTMSYGGIADELVLPTDVDIQKLSVIIDRVSNDLMNNPEIAKKIKEPPKLNQVLGLDKDGVRVNIVGRTGSDNAFEIKDLFYRGLIKELSKAKIKISGVPPVQPSPAVAKDQKKI